MSPCFFLSYARANNGPLVRRFFEDLSLTVRSALSLPRTQPVGFFEQIEYGPDSTWSDGASQALQTCQAMVCLLSPSYFHSELAGREWRVFEMRRHQTGDTGLESLTPIIMPVSWIAWRGPVPKVVSEMLAEPNRIHQREAIMTMFKSSSMSEYAEFVKTLAYKIIDTTKETNPLESLSPMKDVDNAFYLWEESSLTSDELRDANQRPRDNHSNAEPVRTAQVNEQAATIVSDHIAADPSNTQSQFSKNQTQVSKYSVLVISKNTEALDKIEDHCLYFPFEVKRDEDLAHAMRRIRDAIHRIRIRPSQTQRLPELFVIDLDDGPQALEAVKELIEKLDVPSGILALSSNFDSSTLYQSTGATVLFRPFDQHELIENMEDCAERGRSIRAYRLTREQDLSRSRQVFLSYSSDDRAVATVLRRSLEAERIGASYMDEEDAAGKWKDRIASWIAQAQIFLPLVTENYLSSKHCKGELTRFTHPLKAESNIRPLHLIPILCNSPNTHKHEVIESCIKEDQHVELSDADFLNGLATLTARIKRVLAD